MQSTEDFYQSFDDAGMLTPLTWQPSTGGPLLTAKVRYREVDNEYLDGMVTADYPSISFPASWLPGLGSGENVTIDLSGKGQGSAVAFGVRVAPKRMLDGTEIKAYLRRLP
jgi:hypothetical protein